MKEVIANIHIHSVYSDGSKTPPEIAKIAANHNIDVIMITDHNVFPKGFDGYHTYGNRKVLLMTGEEIHDQTRQPQKNHLLALGIEHDFSHLAANSQDLIDQINKAGGLSFIAHAYDPALPMIGERDLSWIDWSISAFTGLELWNNLSEFKIRVKRRWQTFLYAFFPQFMALEPPRQISEIWDTLLCRGEKTVAIGGADAHQLRYHMGSFSKEVFPYSYHFQTINNHILIGSDLSGDPKSDKRTIISAIRDGRVFISNEMIKPGKGFRFYLTDANTIIEMGGSIAFGNDQVIMVHLPYPAECRLICNGKEIDKRFIKNSYSWKIKNIGVYRIECYRKYLLKNRAWIFSNPIYVTKPTP